jgi:diacylglycerol kinase family enzyme
LRHSVVQNRFGSHDGAAPAGRRAALIVVGGGDGTLSEATHQLTYELRDILPRGGT